MKYEIGQLALIGDVWYQIIEGRYNANKGRHEYLLYGKKNWMPENWIKGVRNRKFN